MNKSLFFITALVFFFSCSLEETLKKATLTDFYIPFNSNRTVAEWEPALGTLVVWPLSIPHTLAIELSRDNHLFTMVENEISRQEAAEWYQKWGIDSTKVTFVFAPQGEDAWWTRDWGPSAVFTKTGQMKLGDGKYIYSTPLTDLECNDSLRFLFLDDNNEIELTQIEDDATIPLARQLGFEVLELPFINTGGNVLTDGIGTAFSTCVIRSENEFHGIDFSDFLHLNDSLSGYSQYHMISNFEDHGIQHIDCLLKVIDEETLLVAEPPKGHQLYEIYQDLVTNELSKLKTAFNRPYKILRIKTAQYNPDRDWLAAYTNSLILNKTVYVPLFSIEEDTQAIKTWQAAMPGYQIKGFTYVLDEEPLVPEKLRAFYKNIGWNGGDALHCRTRAIWDPNMLFISVKKIEAEISREEEANLYVTIIDYGQNEPLKNKPLLRWRVKGDFTWETIEMKATDNPYNWFVDIPAQEQGNHIEYYVEAKSNAEKTQKRPMTAPDGYFTFNYL